MTTEDLPLPDFNKGKFFRVQNVFLTFFVPRLKKPEIAIYLAIRQSCFAEAQVSITCAELMKMAGIKKSRCFTALKALEAHWMIRRCSKPGYKNEYICVDLIWAAERLRKHGPFNPGDAVVIVPERPAPRFSEVREQKEVGVPAEIVFHGRPTQIWEVVRLRLKSDFSTTFQRTGLPNEFELFENIFQHPDTGTELLLWSRNTEAAQRALDKYGDRIKKILASFLGFAPTVRLREAGNGE